MLIFFLRNHPMDSLSLFPYRFIAKLLHLCFRNVIQVEEVSDLKKIPHPIIFAYNHNNYYETIVLSSYFLNCWRRRISFVVDWMYGQFPILRWLLQGVQPVYVYNKPAKWDFLNRRRNLGAHNPIAESLDRLAQGWSLGIFPEGSRNRHPFVLKRGRQGIGEIALRSQVPVLPVGIDFPGRVRCGRIPSLGRIILRFGEPLYFTAEIAAWQQAQQDNALSPAVREKLRLYLNRRITHTVMQELARLSGKHYPYRQPRGLALGPTSHTYFLSGGNEDGKNSDQESSRRLCQTASPTSDRRGIPAGEKLAPVSGDRNPIAD